MRNRHDFRPVTSPPEHLTLKSNVYNANMYYYGDIRRANSPSSIHIPWINKTDHPINVSHMSSLYEVYISLI